jgi:NADPH:quinone reductase-like Zn-dependent oxidoreductase
VRATGLNARDLSLLRGVRIYGSKDGPRRIPLDDNAGEILEVGAGVAGFRAGERVVCTHFPLWLDGAWDDPTMSVLDFGVNADGFLAEEAVVPAQGLVRIPDALSFAQAATFPNAGLTAWHAVVEGARVRPGETVVTLGTGGVSVFAFQWAKLLGARVAVTSSSDAKLARMRALGADITVNYRARPDWHEAILEATDGRGADVVVNTVGIAELERSLLACASNARVMQVGANPVRRGPAAAAGVESTTGLRDFPRGMIMRGLRIQGVIVGSRRMLDSALQAAAANGVSPIIDRTFAFAQVREALEYMAGGDKLGKVMIEVA